MSIRIGIILTALCSFIVINASNSENDEGFFRLSLIEQKLNETLVEIAQNITDIQVNGSLHAGSGDQEFGKFDLTIQNGTIFGFGDFVAEIIEFQLLPPVLKNLTLHFRNITLDFNEYNLDGFIDFPLGNQRFDLSGSGPFRVSVNDMFVSVSAKIAANITNGWLVKELIMYVDIGNISVKMDNLLGGGPAGEAFETVLNDAVVPIFDYYKTAIIDAYHDKIQDILSQIINKILRPNQP